MEEKAAQLAQKAISQLSQKISADTLNYAGVCEIALSLAADVAKWEIAGSEKKEFVLDALKSAASEAFAKGAEVSVAEGGVTSEIIDDWITTVLPTTLDLVIGAARGKIPGLEKVAAVAVAAAAAGERGGILSRVVAVGVSLLRGCLPNSSASPSAVPSAVPLAEEPQKVSALPPVELAVSKPVEPQKERESPPSTQESREPEAPLAQPADVASEKSE